MAPIRRASSTLISRDSICQMGLHEILRFFRAISAFAGNGVNRAVHLQQGRRHQDQRHAKQRPVESFRQLVRRAPGLGKQRDGIGYEYVKREHHAVKFKTTRANFDNAECGVRSNWLANVPHKIISSEIRTAPAPAPTTATAAGQDIPVEQRMRPPAHHFQEDVIKMSHTPKATAA